MVKRQLPPPVKSAQPASEPVNLDRFSVVAGKIDSPQRTLLYGPGGIGKSTLAALAPNPVFLDIEGGTRELDVPRVSGLDSFADVRACLQSSALDGFDTVVLDSATRAEEMAATHTFEHVKAEHGRVVKSIEDYGFGKGYTHVYETFLLLLSDLDRQVRQGRNVILIAHECVTNVPNPISEDYIRFEPHLQSPKSGKASIRNRVVQWADHVLFLGYDVIVDESGKGQGAGTRTIYTSELPHYVAKSRRVAVAQPFAGPEDGSIWDQIIGGK